MNGSIVEIYNPAHHRKAESGTAIFSGTAFVYAIETLPNSVQCEYLLENENLSAEDKEEIAVILRQAKRMSKLTSEML